MKLRSVSLAVLLLAVVAFAGIPAMAEVYTIELNSGKSFLTRYQPREASFDPNLVTFLDDQGNLIAISRDEIASVTSEVESKGYGLRINTTTILLGYTANNGVIEGTQVIVSGNNQQSFDIEQFVDPDDAGGGVPVFGINNNSGNFNGGLPQGPSPVPSAPSPPTEAPPSGTVQ